MVASPLKLGHNVGSYTQERTAGDLANTDLRFLSNRKAQERKDAHRKPRLPDLTDG